MKAGSSVGSQSIALAQTGTQDEVGPRPPSREPGSSGQVDPALIELPPSRASSRASSGASSRAPSSGSLPPQNPAPAAGGGAASPAKTPVTEEVGDPLAATTSRASAADVTAARTTTAGRAEPSAGATDSPPKSAAATSSSLELLSEDPDENTAARKENVEARLGVIGRYLEPDLPAASAKERERVAAGLASELRAIERDLEGSGERDDEITCMAHAVHVSQIQFEYGVVSPPSLPASRGRAVPERLPPPGLGPRASGSAGPRESADSHELLRMRGLSVPPSQGGSGARRRGAASVAEARAGGAPSLAAPSMAGTYRSVISFSPLSGARAPIEESAAIEPVRADAAQIYVHSGTGYGAAILSELDFSQAEPMLGHGVHQMIAVLVGSFLRELLGISVLAAATRHLPPQYTAVLLVPMILIGSASVAANLLLTRRKVEKHPELAARALHGLSEQKWNALSEENREKLVRSMHQRMKFNLFLEASGQLMYLAKAAVGLLAGKPEWVAEALASQVKAPPYAGYRDGSQASFQAVGYSGNTHGVDHSGYTTASNAYALSLLTLGLTSDTVKSQLPNPTEVLVGRSSAMDVKDAMRAWAARQGIGSLVGSAGPEWLDWGLLGHLEARSAGVNQFTQFKMTGSDYARLTDHTITRLGGLNFAQGLDGLIGLLASKFFPGYAAVVSTIVGALTWRFIYRNINTVWQGQAAARAAENAALDIEGGPLSPMGSGAPEALTGPVIRVEDADVEGQRESAERTGKRGRVPPHRGGTEYRGSNPAGKFEPLWRDT